MARWAEEGRGWLRKATVSRQQALNRGCPNGETRRGEPTSPHAEHIGMTGVSQGTETSQYLEEKRVFR